MNIAEFIKHGPRRLRAAECAGMLYGRLLSRGAWFEWLEQDGFGFLSGAFNPVLTPPEPTHCGYCYRPLKAGELQRHPTCPTCAGGWEEAVIDLEAA